MSSSVHRLRALRADCIGRVLGEDRGIVKQTRTGKREQAMVNVRKVSDETCDQSGRQDCSRGSARARLWPLRHAQPGRELDRAKWLARKYAFSEIFSLEGGSCASSRAFAWRTLLRSSLETTFAEEPGKWQRPSVQPVKFSRLRGEAVRQAERSPGTLWSRQP